MSVLNLKENLFELPSLGLAYADSKMTLLQGSHVKVRPMTVGDQRHMSGLGGDAYQVYFNMISRLVVEPTDLVIDDLLLDDVNAILYAVRIRSFGEEYSVSFNCSECGAKNKHILSLAELKVRTADDVKDFDDKNLEITLQGQKVTYHLSRLRDEKKISKHLVSLRKTGKVQSPETDKLYVRYAQLIDTVNGRELDIEDKLSFVDDLSIVDLEEFAESINNSSLGVLPDVTIECSNPRCSADNEVRVVASPDFFRPNR
jgi:hypothetical protein